MQKSDMILPIIASIGVGAATYYSITKGNKGIDQVMGGAMSFNGGSGGGGQHKNKDSEKLGPFGMA